MAHPRYPSISLLRALKFSCESFGSHSPSGANTASKLACRYPRQESVRLLSHCRRRNQIHEDSFFFNRSRPNHTPMCGSHNTLFLRCPLRDFSTTSSLQAFKTVQEAKSRYGLGVLQIPLGQALFRGVLFIVTGFAIIMYFREEKARLERKRIAEQTKGIGKPKVGGPFKLVDHNGKEFSDKDMRDKYALVYFGFTHCPDICPDELDKMADMIDRVKAKCGDVLLPIMITCDPARDKPEILKPYLQEFHPDIIGLTGEYEDIKQTCKEYRVYFSTPPELKPGQDYLVDHSIYFYLMDPEGDFVEAIGRNFTAEQAAKVISDHIGDWKGILDKSPRR